MPKRKKRLEKQIIGLEKQIIGLEKQSEKHKEKIKTEEGEKDTTHDYWKREIEEFEKRKREREIMLKKLKKLK